MASPLAHSFSSNGVTQHRHDLAAPPLDILIGIVISLIAAFLCEKLLFTKKVRPPIAP